MYLLQEARYNANPWDTRAESEDLEFSINLVRSWDDFGKYSYRVVDKETGEILYSRLIPYEQSVNIGNPDWLVELIEDYGVPQEIFEAAMLRWWEQRMIR